ncbi:hypothetical protein TEA_013161 [Camellia sinensis var. sinensis]|uniref:Uncharacterized protein n=1 Tax=Camellia sinensis var. sinensis TaxID=542762 RepID=A0A4S4DS85_CAMSN|nr:hypothetical protein TEA_013161 [Camellia sinensis var. sinensis]
MSGNLEFPMNGGDGANSYSKNSRYQGDAINVVKEMIIEAIAKKFDITSLSFSSNTIRIADLDCSVGPNTFNAMKKELLDNGSLAWNKGKIHYTIASKEIANVYAAQFAKDMDTFFNARADEIIVGGMMILIIPSLADGVQYS